MSTTLPFSKIGGHLQALTYFKKIFFHDDIYVDVLNFSFKLELKYNFLVSIFEH